MGDPSLLVDVGAGIARITLNRPEAGNAIDLAMARALVEASIRCETDASIRCVVLTGAGRLNHALRARGKRYGLQTMCEGGGIANVTIVEAL